ncbi:testis-specific serine/threonine-protein kinase 1-like [Brachyistius frenatus]|uniref:testis-specific serine/threonine-protein kinase 1-like n=1 Tax=Brachyistius frenatus TaxID=100188 RepID=UPI0037E92819
MDKVFMERHGCTFQSHLGEGGFGKVVKAYSTYVKKSVAVKIISFKKITLTYKEKFLPHERQIIRSLIHPNIIRTYDIFESRMGTVYMVMELCEKGDLSQYIAVRGAVPETSSCRLFKQLCRGVQYLHDRDVAHRDLKCENLLLDLHFDLKVCDFGFSKTLTYEAGQMVLSETYCGTSSYAAPELLRNCPYNPKVSDVWSMGVVLYMMLYASRPFNTSNNRRMVKMQMKHNINFPNVPPVSCEVKELIRSILHPAVEQRTTISSILKSSWILQEASDEVSTSNAGSREMGAPDEKVKEDEQLSESSSDAEEGPSAAARK